MIHDRDLTVLRELRSQSHSPRDRLVIQDKAADTYHVIRSHDIDWIEAKNRRVISERGQQGRLSGRVPVIPIRRHGQLDWGGLPRAITGSVSA